MVGGIRHGFGWRTNPSAGGLQLSWTINSLQAENFLKTLVRPYGGHGPMVPHGTATLVKVLDSSIIGKGLGNGSIR